MAGPAKTKVKLPTLTKAQDDQKKALEHELRCLVCQNQSLADSNAELAGDLRNQVHTLIASGMNDAEVKAYLVQRYGDFVLYDPPVQKNTALLWGGPFALLGAGAAIWFAVQRRQRRAAQNEAGASEASRQAAREMLGKD